MEDDYSFEYDFTAGLSRYLSTDGFVHLGKMTSLSLSLSFNCERPEATSGLSFMTRYKCLQNQHMMAEFKHSQAVFHLGFVYQRSMVSECAIIEFIMFEFFEMKSLNLDMPQEMQPLEEDLQGRFRGVPGDVFGTHGPIKRFSECRVWGEMFF